MSTDEPQVLQSSQDLRPESPSPFKVWSHFADQERAKAAEFEDTLGEAAEKKAAAEAAALPSARQRVVDEKGADATAAFRETADKINAADQRISEKIAELQGKMKELVGTWMSPGPLTKAQKAADRKTAALEKEIREVMAIIDEARALNDENPDVDGVAATNEYDLFDADGDGTVTEAELADFETQLEAKREALKNDPVIVIYNRLQARYNTLQEKIANAEEKLGENRSTLSEKEAEQLETMKALAEEVAELTSDALTAAENDFTQALEARDTAVAEIAAIKRARVGEEVSDMAELTGLRIGTAFQHSVNTGWGFVKGIVLGLGAAIAMPFATAVEGATRETSADKATDALFERRRAKAAEATAPAAPAEEPKPRV